MVGQRAPIAAASAQKAGSRRSREATQREVAKPIMAEVRGRKGVGAKPRKG